MSKNTKTENLSDIAKVTHQMGDTLNDTFNSTKDLKVAEIALKAYNTAIQCRKTQIIHKKLTGIPDNINGID
jgi:hypothetical protein